MTSSPETHLDTLTAPQDRCESHFYGNSPTTWSQTQTENIAHISYTFNLQGTRDCIYFILLPKTLTEYVSLLNCRVSQVFHCSNRCYDVITFLCLFLLLIISVANKCQRKQGQKTLKHNSTLALWQCGHELWWQEKPKQLLFTVMTIIWRV